jgi:hypothetical protein
MKEQLLLDYLQNKITVEELAADLKGSQHKTGYNFTSVYVDPIKWDGEFEITKGHLLQLCNEAINRKLLFTDLNTIAFAIISSEFFTHNQDDEVTDRVLFQWDNPEICFPLTEENMKKWKRIIGDRYRHIWVNKLNVKLTRI